MRVAVVSQGSPDFLIDIVSDGLLRSLGKANVHLNYNRRSPHDSRFSQLFMGFDYPNAFSLHEADALVISVRTSPQVAVDWMSSTGRRAVAVIDGEDDDVVRDKFFGISKVYFKREYLKGRSYPPNVRALPFAAIPEEVPQAEERTTNVFFCCMIRNEIRSDIVTVLDGMGVRLERGTHENTATIGGLTGKGVYNKRLSRALVGISSRGAGWDTYRYWETPYFGAALLSQRLNIVIPGDFAEGTEAEFFGDMAELRSKLESLLRDHARARAIGDAGARACRTRHLSVHRAATVLDAVV
jgi:hypothetical protein